MSVTSWVVLGLSIATVLLLLGAFVATMRQDRRGRSATPPSIESVVVPSPMPAPVSASAQTGADYDDPREIRVGDRVEVHGVRSRVRGALHVSLQGQQWTEFLLDDGSRVARWLTVEVRQGLVSGDPPHLEVLVWTEVPTQGMIPAKSMIIMEGVEFFPVDRGTAAFRSEGDTGHPDRGLLDFADYRAADGRLLSFERVQGAPWTAAYAQPLTPGSIAIVSTGP